jgi:hypothetical protein
MPVYQAPLRDQQFVLHEVLHAVESLQRMPPFTDLDAETVNQVLEQGGRFCTDVLLPLNLKGDEQGCRFDPVSHEVRTPDGFRAAFDQMRQGGWPMCCRARSARCALRPTSPGACTRD